MFTRDQIVSNLRTMRTDIEADRPLSFEAACVIFDACAAVGLSVGETQHILGPVFFVVEEATDMEGYFNEYPQ